MLSPTIEKLLILQDRDTRRLDVESQMRAVPREIAAVEQMIRHRDGEHRVGDQQRPDHDALHALRGSAR